MQLNGKIQDLSVADLFQYLSAGKKTGTLILEGGRRKAFVYFNEGRIAHAVSPDRTTIGQWLLRTKDLNEKVLKDALELQAGRKKGKPLGRILIEIGAVSKEVLKKAVIRQIREVVVELTSWSEGEFTFEHNEVVPMDDINLNPMETLSSPLDPHRVLIESAGSPIAGNGSSDSGGRSIEPENRARVEDEGDPFSPLFKPGEEKDAKPAEAPGRILFLTEDGFFRNLLRLELEKLGLETVLPLTVRDCMAGIPESLSKGRVPLILLDDNSSGKRRMAENWISLLAGENRTHGSTVPVVVLLREVDYDVMSRLHDRGAVSVLPRPERGKTDPRDYSDQIGALGTLLRSLFRRFADPEKKKNDKNPLQDKPAMEGALWNS